MFKTFINAFKVKDVRRKIFYVLMMLVVIRLGSQMPVPGVNTSFFANYFANNTNEAFSFLNAFTGGGFVLVWRLLVAAWYIPLTIYRLFITRGTSYIPE